MLKSKYIEKIMAGILAGAAVCVVCGGCKSKAEKQAEENNKKEHPTAVITVKDFGVIELELYQDVAPNTVANFISLAKSGFYNGLIFHRVVADFMIQGGCPNGDGYGDPGYSIKGEFEDNGHVNNISHDPGVVSMARGKQPDTAGSQFFICSSENCRHLDGLYAAFGKVTSGMDVVYKIAAVKTDIYDKPTTDVVIESIVVDEKGGNYSYVEKIKE